MDVPGCWAFPTCDPHRGSPELPCPGTGGHCPLNDYLRANPPQWVRDRHARTIEKGET